MIILRGFFRKKLDPARKVALVFSGSFLSLLVRQRHCRNNVVNGFVFEFSGEVEIGEGDVAGALDKDIFGF